MSNLAIKAQGVSKYYRLGPVGQPRYKTLRDQIASTFVQPMKRIITRSENSFAVPIEPQNRTRGSIWALDNVSFQISAGEVVGIIGRNGSGKSTLLKILTRITEPTRGSIDILGRVGSLLEVGTGFHKELTGRENVFLNGAILGMKKTEIDRRFDEIVSFAEVEKFIDTPVKYYSSGMQVRLAFAVAAHMEPEILLVDEVLAVGDASFQKKCLNKMEDVGKEGRTILFVSHHMPSVVRLCERAILLNEGHLLADGPTNEVVSQYLSSSLGTTAYMEWKDMNRAPGNDIVRLTKLRAKTPDEQTIDIVDIREPVGIEMTFEVLRPGYVLYPHFTVLNEEGLQLFASIDTDEQWRGQPRPAGRYTSTAWIPGNLLSEGSVIISPAMRTEKPRIIHFAEKESIAFHVVESPDNDGARVDYPGRFPGVLRPYLQWQTQYHPAGNGSWKDNGDQHSKVEIVTQSQD